MVDPGSTTSAKNSSGGNVGGPVRWWNLCESIEGTVLLQAVHGGEAFPDVH